MRESNFCNPVQNRACLTISPAIYDRRAIDCTATLPLINSLNHLAYLTSTSPRIREMVTLDGGLERLIRILRQVPRAPTVASLRAGVTKEMQAIWKWTLAFQCMVNVGVRGSEMVRTRVVEAGMVPITVRVLESYLRTMVIAKEERRRQALSSKLEARMAEERQRHVTATADEQTTAAAVALVANLGSAEDDGRGERLNSRRDTIVAPHQPSASPASASRRWEASAVRGLGRPAVANLSARREEVAPTGSVLESGEAFTERARRDAGTAATAASAALGLAGEPSSDEVDGEFLGTTMDPPSPGRVASLDAFTPPEATRAGVGGPVVPMLSELDHMALDGEDGGLRSGISPSTSASSVVPVDSTHAFASSSMVEADALPVRTGLLSNVSSVEDFGAASGSGSEAGAEDSEMYAEDVEESGEAASSNNMRDSGDDAEDRRTPRPPRRVLAPLSSQTVEPLRYDPVTHAATPRGVVTHDRAPASQPLTSDATIRANGPPQAGPAATVVRREPAARVRDHDHRARAVARLVSQDSGEMVYREEEVLLSLQLLAYLSKYAHVRALFHSSDLSSSTSLDEMDAMLAGDGSTRGTAEDKERNVSWHPEQALQRNVFSIAEKFTLRSSRSSQSSLHPKLAPEIQYWAGVIMRNACRKDESRGGIRQCANMLCGKWESCPREFAKCRRCRKAKYCSKQCQSKGWQMGHRFWCSAKDHDSRHGAEGDADVARQAGDVSVAREQAGHADARAAAQSSQGTTTDATATATDAVPGNDVATVAAAVPQARNAPVSHTAAARRHSMSTPPTLEGAAATRHPSRPPFEPSAARPAQATPGHLQASRHLHLDSRVVMPQAQRRARGVVAPNEPHRAMQSGRLTAIPNHMAAMSGAADDASRPSTSHSSGAETSDASDEDSVMRHASARVATSGMPAQTRRHLMLHRSQDDDADLPPPPAPRTDLAGRPLPPPVIAQPDGGILGGVGDPELLALQQGGLAPVGVDVGDDQDVFGRGDIDQMVWRGRTPVGGGEEDGIASTRASTITDRPSDVDTDSPPLSQATSTSHGDGVASAAGERLSPDVAALYASVARAARRFASVNVGAGAGTVDVGAPHRLSEASGSRYVHGAARALAAGASSLPSHSTPSLQGLGRGSVTTTRGGDVPVFAPPPVAAAAARYGALGTLRHPSRLGGAAATAGASASFAALPRSATGVAGLAMPRGGLERTTAPGWDVAATGVDAVEAGGGGGRGGRSAMQPLVGRPMGRGEDEEEDQEEEDEEMLSML